MNITPTEEIRLHLESNTSSDAIIWTGPVVQRVTTLAVIMLMALVGNSFIITVLTTTSAKRRFSRVNIFIINLAIGDLCVCAVTMTTEIVFVAFGQWVLGAVMCKLVVYGQIVTLASTTFILTAMTIDRHRAITQPLRFQTESSARRMIALSWLLAFVVAIPQLLIFVEQERQSSTGAVKRVCVSQGYTAEWQRQAYVTWMTFYVLVAPTVVISYCYLRIVWTLWHTDAPCPAGRNCSRARTSTISKAKVKTIKMTVCIIIGFVTCWTPYFVVTLHDVHTGKSLPDVTYVVAETMALFNSAFNPIVYGLFSVKMKSRWVKEVCCRQAKKKQNSGYSTSATPRTELDSGADGSTSYRSRTSSPRNRQTGKRENPAYLTVELAHLTVANKNTRTRLQAETAC